MADKATLDVYAKRAADYARHFAGQDESVHLNAFIAAMPEGGHVLDLGCGTGDASAAMRRAGLAVDSWDASVEMGATAKALHGVAVRQAVFEDLTAEHTYDGIYANFSLLHAPKADMPGHLARIAKALKPGGHFHIGTKLGEGERRDTIGRFYAYYSADELTGLLQQAGFEVLEAATGEEPGLDGVIAPFIILLTQKTP